jgi:flap endonuclease-1
MGIQGLTKLIGDVCPGAIRETKLENHFGRKIGLDASMAIYQFLIAIRSSGGDGGAAMAQLTNEAGEITSHLQGMFYRTIRMLENGLKPIYVFDGKPPELKTKELEQRREKRAEAEAALKEAIESGDTEAQDKFSKRTVRATREQSEDCKRLLKLMGVPYFEAASEAEAQCATLCAKGKLFATATEDMDALTFGTPVLLRHLTFSEARKMPVMEIHLNAVLEGLKLDMESFIDLCILMGCDYLPKVQGVGPKTAYNLILKYKTIEAIRNSTADECKKLSIPYTTEEYNVVREFFKTPDVTQLDDEFKFSEPDEEGLLAFLSDEKGFARERVLKGVEKIKKTKEKATQGRLESFFGPSTLIKRKVEAPPPKGAKKAKTGSSKGGGKPRR